MRPKHRDAAAGWYPAVHVSVFSSDATFSGAPLTHAHASQAQRFSRWLVSCSARALLLSSDYTFYGAPFLVFCVPLRKYQLLSTLSTHSPQPEAPWPQ